MKPISFNHDFDIKVIVAPAEYLQTIKILKKYKAKCVVVCKYLKHYGCKMYTIVYTCNLKTATPIYKAIQSI
jgi:hypothetical protein